MTPEQFKAEEIVNKFHYEINKFTGNKERHSMIFAKRCAVMHINGIIEAINHIQGATHDVIQWHKIKSFLL